MYRGLNVQECLPKSLRATDLKPELSTEKWRAVKSRKIRKLSASVVLEGEYGLEGIAMSLPCVISRNGVERTLQIPLDKEGEKNLKICYDYLRGVIESIS